MTTRWFERTRQLAVALTGFFSQTDTPGERDFGSFLLSLLGVWAYFQEHPEQAWLEKTVNDPSDRYVVMALVRGQGPRTLILTGHYDVVEIENYGELAEWACDSDELLPRLVSRLEEEQHRGSLSAADSLALEDLKCGDFLPGRGLLDMKSGLAAGLAVLERFSQVPEDKRVGNLLFMGVPDEEIASNGARSAALRLPGTALRFGLSLEGLVNLDASNDLGDGKEGQTAYLGSVGKLLPSVYLVGRETHAGSPFSGVSAALLAAELTRLIECNPELFDQGQGQFTPPPVCLKMEDTKGHYDVTTPVAAWCYYNWQVFSQAPGQVLAQVLGLARQALDATLTQLQEARERYGRHTGQQITSAGWQGQVYTFAQVKRLALERGGDAFHKRLEELEGELAKDAGFDTPQVALRITEAVWAGSGLSGPAAVVGFATIYYPPVYLDPQDPRAQAFQETLLRQAATVSRDAGTTIQVRPFFPGISDISFLSGRIKEEEVRLLKENSPAWQGRTGFDYSLSAGLGLPAANIGPWGRDYHQRTERVQMTYSFGVLPEYLWRVCEQIFEQP